MKIGWGGRDTANRAVEIPAAGKTSVVVFLRPGQAQSEEEIKELSALVKDRKDLQIIGIVSGDEAGLGGAKLTAAGSKWNWPVVVDGEYVASGKFGVRVWPTTVVVGEGGEQVAHIAGLPVSFGNDLPAYLDFAAKKIDQAGLEKRLADRQVVADSTDQKAARHVEVAQRLAGKGMADEARKELASALALAPKDVNILVTIARTDLMIGDTKEAEGLLAKLKDSGVRAGEMNLLKGWCALEMERWDEAKKILTEAAKLNPEPAEAFYLLGRVYEHEGDLKQAAEFYRKAFERSAGGKGMGV